jgi:hypothetical protein
MQFFQSQIEVFVTLHVTFGAYTKYGGVTVTQTNAFNNQLRKYFGPNRPLSRDSLGTHTE